MIDLPLIVQSLPALWRGTLVTLQIAGLSGLIGMLLGTVLGIAHTSQFKPLRWLITAYVTIIRGTPMLIQITIAFYVLPQLGLGLPAFWAAVCAIGLNSAAYVSQIIKAGILSINKGQVEAAYTLGLSRMQTLQYIVLPQAFKVVTPALGNEFITLVKDSSLASVIGVVELTREGSLIRSRTFDYFTLYAAIALIYLIITTTLSILVSIVEQRMNQHAKN
ncbi:MAG: amino acid ABC transporter permease [Candidatus Dependentiae bacterium]